MAIAWVIQARVNEHDQLASKIFSVFNLRKIYHSSGQQFFGESPEDLKMGERNYHNRMVSFLKYTFTHREMRKVLKDSTENRIAAEAMMKETREAAKGIAKQVAKSYAVMLSMPDSEISSRRRRRR
jgi:hypothetical protein